MTKGMVVKNLKGLIKDREMLKLMMFCDSYDKMFGIFKRNTFKIEPHSTYYTVYKSAGSFDFVNVE